MSPGLARLQPYPFERLALVPELETRVEAAERIHALVRSL